MEDCVKLDQITLRMVSHDAGSPKRIQHFLKVHRFAQLIGRAEQLEAHTQFVLECAALVHDIAIGPCKQKYGRCTSELQEVEGPVCARALLAEFALEEEDMARICHLVTHHHYYDQIDGIDYQILVEADLLVNIYEQQMTPETVQKLLTDVFRTETGKNLCKAMLCLNNGQQNAGN